MISKPMPESELHRVEHAEISDVGMRRANNQDSYTVVVANHQERFAKVGHLFVVADGMGAHAAGELASKIATDKIAHHYLRNDNLDIAESLRRAITSANMDIHRRGQENPEFYNMGTTASSLVLAPQGAIVGHVGDSRVYRIRGGVIEQLTFDHSLVWEMQAAGQVRPGSDLCESIPKNVITRSLGPNSEVNVDVEGPFPTEPGDVFLLCSDGLSGQVTDEEIGALLTALDPDAAVRVLVDLANLRGGPDNITVIITKVLSGSGDAIAKQTVTKPVLPLPLLVASAVITGLALLFFASGNLPLAGLSLVLAIGALIFVVIQLRWRPATKPLDNPKTPVKASSSPYRRFSSKPKREHVLDLASTIQQIRKVAEQRRWNLDWANVDRREREAQQALESGQTTEALRFQALAIRETMVQLREQQNRAAGETTIEE